MRGFSEYYQKSFSEFICFGGNVSMKYFGKYTQLFCPVPTSIKRGGSIPWKDYSRILKQYDDYMAEFPA